MMERYPGNVDIICQIKKMKIFDELEARGLVKQTTNTEKIRSLLNGDEPITFYIGFDPTADSLHVGHLLQVLTAKRLGLAGHKPIMLIGGATASIGDPTGKTSMRPMLTPYDLDVNHKKLQMQMFHIMMPFYSWKGDNNRGWFNDMRLMNFLHEVGAHFSVNNMLRADCFKSRMEHGLSFLEFNYMLLQAFDFLHLNKEENCVLQIGGDDQWANILAGIDLVHKKEKKEVFGLTLPLLVNSDGTKMGKTEKGAVWLDKEKTSVFDFFQFWRNVPDDKVKQFIDFFSFVDICDPKEFDPNEFVARNINWAKKFLAFQVTSLVHGEPAAQQALKQVEALFESQDASALEATPIEDGIQLLDLLVQSSFAKSRTDARNQINNRGIAINDQVLDNPTLTVTRSMFGNELTLRKGKKNFCRFIIKD